MIRLQRGGPGADHRDVPASDPDPRAGLPTTVATGPLRVLCLVAGVLGLVSLALPHDPSTSDGPLLGVSVAALVVAGGMQVAAHVVPRPVFSALLGVGTLLASAAILTTDGLPNASSALYTWVALYAFYALPRAHAVGHVAFIAGNYAALCVVVPPDYPPWAHFSTGMGTLLAAGLLVASLRRRLDDVIVRLADAARTDPLTGLLNRRGLREALDQELGRAERTGAPLALVLLDLDHFKQVNDERGHSAGDAVLRELAAVLEDGARRADRSGRLGGDEFALLLPDTDAAGARVAAERLLADLDERGIAASVGFAVVPEAGTTEAALHAAADRSLYAAKRAGRGRVGAAGRPLPLARGGGPALQPA